MFELVIAGNIDLLGQNDYDATRRLAARRFFWADCYSFAEWVNHRSSFLAVNRMAFGDMYCARPELGVFAASRKRTWFPTTGHYYV